MFSSSLTLPPGRVSAPFPMLFTGPKWLIQGQRGHMQALWQPQRFRWGKPESNTKKPGMLLPGVGFSPVKNATQLLTEQELS